MAARSQWQTKIDQEYATEFHYNYDAVATSCIRILQMLHLIFFSLNDNFTQKIKNANDEYSCSSGLPIYIRLNVGKM